MNQPSAAARHLLLLRHAKAVPPGETADRDRALAPRGRRDAVAAGRWLREARLVPDLTLCSTATRTRQTWELAAAQLGAAQPSVACRDEAYLASPATLLGLVRACPDQAATVLVVGHNPGLHELAFALCAGRSAANPDAAGRLAQAFPTCALAVLAWSGSWRDLAPGGADLAELATPRG